MGETLALASALCFGVTHFANGLVSRRVDGIAVALYAQLAGSVVAVLWALVDSGGGGTSGDYWFGALSGVGTGVGVAFLYRAMSRGQMSVVVPVSDVGAVALPVLVGVVFLGETLAVVAWGGVVVAVPALWLPRWSRVSASGCSFWRWLRWAGDGGLWSSAGSCPWW